MPAVVTRHRAHRKPTNAENLGARAKQVPYKASRLACSDPLRDSSIRRRNRVLSSRVASFSIVDHVKKQKRLRPEPVLTLPTPPASPGHSSVDMMDVEPSVSCSQSSTLSSTSSSSRRSQNTLNLPTALRRPPTAFVQDEDIEAVDPEALDGIPRGYVRRATEYLAPSMLNVINGIKMQPYSIPPGQAFPTEADVVVTDVSGDMPTHILAVPSPSPSDPSRLKVEMFPVHHLIVATHCARLSLPQARPSEPVSPGSTLTLPVVPLTLNHPESFSLIESYLYTKNANRFLAALLPHASSRAMLAAAQTRSTEQFAAMIADTFTPQAILRHIKYAHGVYANMCTLGIHDDKMWIILQKAWEMLLMAASTSARRSTAGLA